jgi:chromosome segregation ATPase
MDYLAVNQEQRSQEREERQVGDITEDESKWSDVDYINWADEVSESVSWSDQNSDEEPDDVTPAEVEKMASTSTPQFVGLSDFQALEAKLEQMQNQWSAGHADAERGFVDLVEHCQEWSDYLEATTTQTQKSLSANNVELVDEYNSTRARIDEVSDDLSDFKRMMYALTAELVEAIEVMKPLVTEHREMAEQVNSEISQLKDGLNCQFLRLSEFEEELKEVKESTIGLGKSLLEAIRIVKPLANEHEGLVKAHEGLSEILCLVQADLVEIRQSQVERCAERIHALEACVSKSNEEVHRLNKQLAELSQNRIRSAESLDTWKDKVCETTYSLVEVCVDRIKAVEENVSINNDDIFRLNSRLSNSITDADKVTKTQQETLALREHTKEMLERVNSNNDHIKRLDRKMDQLNERLFESVVGQVKHEDIRRLESQFECLSIHRGVAERTASPTASNEKCIPALEEQTYQALETIARNSKDVKPLNRDLDELSGSFLGTNRKLETIQADIRESADESKKEYFPELESSLRQLTPRVDDAEIKYNILAKQHQEMPEAEVAIWQKTILELQNTVKLISGELNKLMEQSPIINTCIHNAEMERGRLVRQQQDTDRYAEQTEEALGHCFDQSNVQSEDLQLLARVLAVSRHALSQASITEQKQKLDAFMNKAAADIEVETEKARKGCSNLRALSRAGVVVVQDAIDALAGLGEE